MKINKVNTVPYSCAGRRLLRAEVGRDAVIADSGVSVTERLWDRQQHNVVQASESNTSPTVTRAIMHTERRLMQLIKVLLKDGHQTDST